MNLANRIQTMRKARGISQEELADQLGVSRQAVSKWESEQSQPELDKLLLLSDFFGVSCDYLLRGAAGQGMPETATQSAQLEPVDARIFTVGATVLNVIGLLTAIFGWYSYQRPIWTALGLCLQIFGCACFVVGQYLPTENKAAAKWQFIRINSWLVSFIPLSLICNFITGFGFHQFRPIPIIFWRTRLWALRLLLWPCCYFIGNLAVQLWVRKKSRQAVE
ncbi:MAG: helix-turn-helix transcriptional regulator [Firmicutes bacterium]|nr:helix-turn-helix transcriptional regulator [Bacillota bacterium]